MPPRTDSRRPLANITLAIACVLSAAFVASPMGAPRPGTVLTTVSPTTGSNVSGTVPWRVAVVRGAVPGRVDFYVDGRVVFRDGRAPFEMSLDTRRLTNGVHALSVRGGGARSSVSVSVSNAPAPPPPEPPKAPSAVSSPTVSGTPVTGMTLVGSTGAWDGATPMSYAFQWQRCDANGGACAPVSGATASTYTPSGSDLGTTLRLAVQATNTAGSSTATSTATAAVTSPASSSCAPPYASGSPWNTPIRSDVAVLATSETFLGALGDDTITSTPLEYAYPVHVVDDSTPTTTITVRNTYSDVSQGGTVVTKRRDGFAVTLRLPADARASQGSDGHLVVVDRETGDEWGFWQASRDASGSWSATNGYHYNTAWSGVPPSGFGSRGAGVTYLAGLIRPCEIAQGRIDHALAFAYNYPRNTFVYPATKTDGLSTSEPNLPEGARLQLDPTIDVSTIRSWGCLDACLVMARAMQVYGMYVVDNSGRDKIYTEDESTAHWGGIVRGSTANLIPKRHLRWVAPPS